MYELDGRQKKALHAALRHAFPRATALERLVEFHLDEHLAVIAGEGALDDVIFRLIAWAEAQGRLDALVNGARVEVPGNPHLLAFERTVVEARDARPLDSALRTFAERVRLAPTLPDEPDLEKRVFRAGFSDIAQWRARLGQAELAVCRIEAPAWRALGTGFLVGPDLVMTNRHVIEALADHDAPPIVARFDFKLSPDGSRLREGETFALAPAWLVASSPVADLDFALLRLASAAGLQPAGGTPDAPPRGWVTPAWRELEADETIFVIQHPQGDALKLASGRFDSREPTRLRYRVDTEPGSSGSPCFTAQLELVALHRGSAEGLANQGVPFDAITRALPAATFPAPPGESPEAPARPNAAAPPAPESLPAPPRAPRRRLTFAAAALVAVALAAVPYLWFRPADGAVVAVPETAGPTSALRPTREITVQFTWTQVQGVPWCAADAQHSRALYRLETTGPWPVAAGPRAREIQLVAVGDIEIEEASVAMRGGREAAAVSQSRRTLVRKWVFPEDVQAPVVVVACVRGTGGHAGGTTPEPAFRLTTWKEMER
ncbi:hypothetical protein TBR22_A51500 [Luteitalea sp. TBR-22]|uniref:trypsin-like peptidase domain-containing protein n=1 Tax=Luteitalea sp. TBR-22 TaxID=2802971 RepID=UPI001AF71D4B|nr:effector-associated domain EAD1-containing protein [Luteitalea sp. TBR-22]BCS35915.1 hypothetical protein TBR22_A51500 [Luteitalea sp. TBR-22]